MPKRPDKSTEQEWNERVAETNATVPGKWARRVPPDFSARFGDSNPKILARWIRELTGGGKQLILWLYDIAQIAPRIGDRIAAISLLLERGFGKEQALVTVKAGDRIMEALAIMEMNDADTGVGRRIKN